MSKYKRKINSMLDDYYSGQLELTKVSDFLEELRAEYEKEEQNEHRKNV